MMKANAIRCLALAIIRNGERVLASPGHDDIKNEDFYRLPGGGIEFGETSRQALEREIKEEFAAELKDIRLLKVIENVFTFNGVQGHEVCFIYEASFIDQSLYQQEELRILDSDSGRAVWARIAGQERVYPQGTGELLKSN